jgi:hypothetical protein
MLESGLLSDLEDADPAGAHPSTPVWSVDTAARVGTRG